MFDRPMQSAEPHSMVHSVLQTKAYKSTAQHGAAKHTLCRALDIGLSCDRLRQRFLLAEQELRGVHCACEALEQTVLHLKQRLGTEATKQAELAGKRNSLCSLEL